PKERTDSAASNTEDLVRPPKDAPIEPAPTSPRSQGGTRLISLFGPTVVEAQAVPDLKTRTPEVVAVIESRRTRFPELAAAMTRGCIGENNLGLLEARPGTGCPRPPPAPLTAGNR